MLDDLTRPATLAPNLVDLLRWVEDRPRTYGETMEVWRTSCPKLPAWEDAVDQEMVRVDPSSAGTYLQAAVQLTPRGKAALGSAGAPRRIVAEPLAPLSFDQIMTLLQKAYV